MQALRRPIPDAVRQLRVRCAARQCRDPRVFAFEVAPSGGPGDHLRVELADGAGHGVKVTLTLTGSDPAERDAAAQMQAQPVS